MISNRTSPITMTEVTDPTVLAEIQAAGKTLRRIPIGCKRTCERVRQHRGKCICVSGGELIVADTAEEVSPKHALLTRTMTGSYCVIFRARRMERSMLISGRWSLL